MIIGAVAMISYSVAIVTVNHFEKRRLIGTYKSIFIYEYNWCYFFSNFGGNSRNHNNMCVFISRYTHNIRISFIRSCYDKCFHWRNDNNSCCYFSDFNEVRIIVSIVFLLILMMYFRGTALSLSSMFGRSGSLVGNILFPVLLKTGCKPPFFLLGSIIVGSTLMGLLLPRISSKTIA